MESTDKISTVLVSFRRLGDRTSEIANRVGTYILVAMLALTVADVCGRYVFNRPIVGSFEITEIMMVFVVFLGVAYRQVQKGHVSISFLADRLPEKARVVVDTVMYVLCFVTLVILAWQSVVQSNLLYLKDQTIGTLLIPIYPFLWVVALGSVLFILVILADLGNYFSRLIRNHSWGWLALGLVLAAALYAIGIGGHQLSWQVSPGAIGYISIGLMFLLMFLGMPVGFVMMIAGFLGIAYLSGFGPSTVLMRNIPYSQSASYFMTVLPLFVLMGAFATHSGLGRDLYKTGYSWLGFLPGGLAMATVFGCAGFSAVSGSSMATAAAMGNVALPEMKKHGYSDSLAAGCIAAGGTMGVLIPPSTLLVIYGIMTEQSIGKLFLAGVFPGILEAVFYIAVIFLTCKLDPKLGPAGASTSLREKFVSLKGTWQMILLFTLVISGIYAGIFTANEAAGIGAFVALILVIVRKRISVKKFQDALLEGTGITAMCIFIVTGAAFFGYFLAVTRLPFDLATWIANLPVDRYIIMSFIILVYVVMGCFIGAIAMITVTIPIFFPLVLALGFDPIWFGIIIVRVTEIGAITPPYGINVFIIKGVAKDVPLNTIYKGVTPFIIADILHVILLVSYPGIATWLPSMMK